MTYGELYNNCIDRLDKAGIIEKESDAGLLFYYLLGIDRGKRFMVCNDEADADSCAKIEEALNLREQRIPLQHITGFQDFMGLEFAVTGDVLIPRFDTETLVEETMLVARDGDKVLDVCTGSGCIIISLMNYKNDIDGVGCDISEKALDIAEKNAIRLCKPNEEYCCGITDEIIDNADLCKPRFICSNLFENIDEHDFDVIVSNPPYIRSSVIETLEPEVREYDPMLALDGGEDGLDFYRRIIGEAPEYLKKGGNLLVEIGHDQGKDVEELFRVSGFRDIKVVKDLAGNDRVVRGYYV